MLNRVQGADLKLLRVFIAIIESGGFSLAQAKLNMSQSTISTHMSQLETRLGFRLCERGRGAFKLTEEGRGVYAATVKLFSALEDFQVDAAAFHRMLKGELRVGVIDNSVTHPGAIIQKAIGRFRQRAPGVDIVIYVGGAVELEESVMDGRLHLALGLFHHKVEGLDYAFLFEEEHHLYCSVGHPLFNVPDDDLSVKQVLSADYVGWGYIENLSAIKPSISFKVAASTPYMEGVAYLILSGQFIGFLPSHYADPWVMKNEMRPLIPSETHRSAQFHLVTRRGGSLPIAAAEFLKEIKPS